MDKKQYESPEMQVILTTGEDIITTSGIDESESPGIIGG